jgi:hypothetical protein
MARASRFADVDAVRARHGARVVDPIIRGAFAGDPPADALVAAFRGLPGGAGWAMLERALAEGRPTVPGAPPELAALLEPVLRPPAWVDLDLVDRGADAWWRPGAAVLHLTLLCGSLAYGYRSASLVRPLAATGRLERMAGRRVGETTRWALETTTPGAMRSGPPGTGPPGPGIAASVRVRTVHALVRAHLARSPAWDTANWGVPLSAADGLATAIAGFLVVPQRAMRDLGVRHSPADLDAMTHQWSWIAYVFGVPEHLLPGSWEQARTMVAAGLELDSGPDEDSVRLMRALLRHGLPVERVLPRALTGAGREALALVLGGFTRRWLDDELADALGVPRTPLRHAALLARPPVLLRQALCASGLLGSPRRIARLESALARRISGAGRPLPPHIEPAEAAAQGGVLAA